jgi:hypothetical protein
VGPWGKAVNMSLGAIGLACTGLIVLGMSNESLGTWGAIIPYMIIYGIGRGFRVSNHMTALLVCRA